jgi:hypothetical protein
MAISDWKNGSDWRLVIGGTDFDWRAHLPMRRNFSAVQEHCPPEKPLSTLPNPMTFSPRWQMKRCKNTKPERQNRSQI